MQACSPFKAENSQSLRSEQANVCSIESTTYAVSFQPQSVATEMCYNALTRLIITAFLVGKVSDFHNLNVARTHSKDSSSRLFRVGNSYPFEERDREGRTHCSFGRQCIRQNSPRQEQHPVNQRGLLGLRIKLVYWCSEQQSATISCTS